MLFLKLMVISLCISLLSFALLSFTLLEALKTMALCTVGSIAITAFYPEVRGIRQGDVVSVVGDAAIPSIIGRLGTAASGGRRKERTRIMFQNGAEVLGVIEDYEGIISPPKIRLIYEEKPVY